jgi:hypothetical protein
MKSTWRHCLGPFKVCIARHIFTKISHTKICLSVHFEIPFKKARSFCLTFIYFCWQSETIKITPMYYSIVPSVAVCIWSATFFGSSTPSFAVGTRLTLRLRDKGVLKVRAKQSHYRPWQALKVPGGWGSPILRQLAHEGGKGFSPTHRPPLHQEILLVLISLRRGVDPRAIVPPEGICHWHHRVSKPRTSGLWRGATTTTPPRAPR